MHVWYICMCMCFVCVCLQVCRHTCVQVHIHTCVHVTNRGWSGSLPWSLCTFFPDLGLLAEPEARDSAGLADQLAACLSSGARWLQLSDHIRWPLASKFWFVHFHREGFIHWGISRSLMLTSGPPRVEWERLWSRNCLPGLTTTVYESPLPLWLSTSHTPTTHTPSCPCCPEP